MPKFKCATCGKEEEAETAPECCGAPMEEVTEEAAPAEETSEEAPAEEPAEEEKPEE